MKSLRHVTALAVFLGIFGWACERAPDSLGPGGDAGLPSFDVTTQSAPSNDNFGSATAILALPFSDVVDIAEATTEPPAEPAPSAKVGSAPASQDPELLRRLLRAKDRMDVASDEEWPVKRLARVSGVSEAHFARSFKEAFGIPPHRYLLSRRIERAKALLRDTDLSITQIALQTGWNSVGTFGRTFRDVTGESPGELRAREQPASYQLALVPACFAAAGARPGLTIAVSEKRRQEAGGKTENEEVT